MKVWESIVVSLFVWLIGAAISVAVFAGSVWLAVIMLRWLDVL